MLPDVRYEYHFILGRVIEHKIARPEGIKRWRFQLKDPSLIAVIEPKSESFSLHEGPAATQERVVDAVRYYKGLAIDPNIPDFSVNVPVELAKDISYHIAECIRNITAQYASFAEETDITGFLKGAIQKGGFIHEDWQAEIKAWTYTRRPKEHVLGVDIGVLIDLLHRNLRVIKAMWFQAKKADKLPNNIFVLRGLQDQIRKMQQYTSESYALIYTPGGISTFKGDSPRESLKFEKVIYDGLFCRRGDRTPRVVALTGDSKLIIDILVSDN